MACAPTDTTLHLRAHEAADDPTGERVSRSNAHKLDHHAQVVCARTRSRSVGSDSNRHLRVSVGWLPPRLRRLESASTLTKNAPEVPPF